MDFTLPDLQAVIDGLWSPEFGIVMLLTFMVCEALFSFETFAKTSWWNGFKHITVLTVGGLLGGFIVAIPVPETIPSWVAGALAAGITDRLVAKFKNSN